MNFTPLILEPHKEISKKKTMLISIIIFGTVVILLLFSSFILFGNKKNLNNNSSAKSQLTNSEKDPSKYDKDTDGDFIPDFIETEMGLDPTSSDYDKCKKTYCENAKFSISAEKKKNVLIILDASGSMGLKIGDKTRIDIAKEAIKNYIRRASSSINIGLMIYGHEGSNSKSDKPISCKSAEIIGLLGSVTAQTIDEYLTRVKPVGWTPTGLAIKKSAEAFIGKESEDNQIIIVSDGEETCNTNPIEEAKEINASQIKAKINIIGFAVDSTTQDQLSQISSAGGGVYSTASNEDELNRKFNEQYENSKKFTEEVQCKSKELEEFMKCYLNEGGIIDSVIKYLGEKAKTLASGRNSREEITKIYKLQDDLFSKRSSLRQQEMDTYNQDFKDRKKDLNFSSSP